MPERVSIGLCIQYSEECSRAWPANPVSVICDSPVAAGDAVVPRPTDAPCVSNSTAEEAPGYSATSVTRPLGSRLVRVHPMVDSLVVQYGGLLTGRRQTRGGDGRREITRPGGRDRRGVYGTRCNSACSCQPVVPLTYAAEVAEIITSG